MTSTDNVKNICWLIGKWKSTEAIATFPTIESFNYKEELTFTHLGQPMLNFSFRAWNPKNNQPMHLESGFLRVKPGTDQLAFMCAQNFGIAEIEEGEVSGKEINLESKTIVRMSFSSDPHTTKISRKFRLVDDNTLEQTVKMATVTNPDLTQHLKVVYTKCSECE